MHKSLKIAVVIPCFNEEIKIKEVISTMPDMVDCIYLVDDASSDDSIASAQDAAQSRGRQVLKVLRHANNSGVGVAIATGYKQAFADGFDIVVVMAGDGQMDPSDFEALIQPVIDDQADYVKGNRFKARGDKIPTHRLVGNLVLSALTKIVSGYWHVSDTQCGYTAINRAALEAVNWDSVYPRYGCPNDILTRLNVAEMRVAEVRVKPCYGDGWSSKMKVRSVVAPIIWLLGRLFIYRMFRKYIYQSGHPIVLYYLAGAFFGMLTTLLFFYIIVKWMLTGAIPTVALIMFSTTLGVMIQLVLNAFSMDFQVNRDLCIEIRHRELHYP